MGCRRLLKVCLFLTALSFPACGNADGTAISDGPRTSDACSLLTQEEVDTLFPGSIGPGRPDASLSRIQGCVWPAEGLPQLMLQVLPAPSSVRESIDPGTGYRTSELAGMSGEAAVAVQLAVPEYGLAEGVAILGVKRGERMVTLSPVHLEIQEESPEFARLKELADLAAQRL